ncbi:hypothetical protein [Actinoplanes philippinensis]|uniref:hypothetical protein n=1 Tax=Actinoplanes philippinensis TaxID=35752 RepID=UPI00340F7A6E
MNIIRNEPKSTVVPEFACRVTHPTLGRSVVDSALILGRTTLISGVGAVALLGAAIVIAYLLAGALGILGVDASGSY